MFRSLLLAFLVFLIAPAAYADKRRNDAVLLASEGFLSAHPDLKYRQRGLKAWQDGNYEKAFQNFERAARWADKPSQGMIAEMLWRGEGLTQDRALAYAWMDLAAQRMYRPMLIQREIYWNALSEAERAQAIEHGKRLYAEYGDAVAKPRLESKMKRARRNSTGSRTGPVGSLVISIPTPGGTFTIDGATYYHPDYWEPERYWAWQEKGWKDPPRGSVQIGPLGRPDDSPRQ